ncbi:unnamed protein product [Enterobius vermicularis]|uniref:Endostatin domain-containing protein n=1 Tax=Enterobius vermicularis TaxID=51028 RepID=A0A0N4VGP0_ENTVE|nr:unnamed protein product [Enterobius vermicularis]
MSQIHLIALDQPYNGKILLYGRQGIRAADYACHLASREYGHKETFQALLSSSFQDLRTVVRRDEHNAVVVNA